MLSLVATGKVISVAFGVLSLVAVGVLSFVEVVVVLSEADGVLSPESAGLAKMF